MSCDDWKADFINCSYMNIDLHVASNTVTYIMKSTNMVIMIHIFNTYYIQIVPNVVYIENAFNETSSFVLYFLHFLSEE